MKRFYPEKELNKVQYGDRNKLIGIIIFLLVIIAIGSTYALYQVRHTNKLVFTTVDEFVKKDIIVSVLIDNESKPDFPLKEDGYVYSDYECENDGVITFDSEKWEFTLKNNKPDKCVIKFSSNPFKANACKDLPMSECLLLEEQHTNEELAYDDPDANARYIGATPSNYIWFNCDDYNNPTEDTCERWRIIGSFNNIEKVNEDGESTTKQNLVKIMRNTNIGIIPWDNKAKNDWTNSSLQVNLNNEYLIENDDGNWITSEENIKNNSYNNTSKSEDYKSITFNTIKMVENVVWYLGGYDSSTTLSEFYPQERSQKGSSSAPNTTIWKGKIALIYASDAAYAINEKIRGTCFQMNPNSLSWECRQNNWLAIMLPTYIWLINPDSTNTYNARTFTTSSNIKTDGVRLGVDVHPSLYLTHDTKISGGDGTYENPYTIAIQ